MLKWFGGSKVDHPLADVKDARELVNDLPGDSVRALDQMTRWLEPLKDTEGLRTDRLFEIVELVDSAARNHQPKLFHDYLTMSRQQKLQEHKVWTCGFNFAKEVADAYQLCVSRCDGGASGAGAVRKNLAVIVARAMRALAFQMKWTMLRYAPIEARVWGALGSLYRYAQTRGFADTSVTIYAGIGGRGTVQQEYLKALMLSASRVDVLPPLKQGIADRLIAHFADGFRLEKESFDGALCAFDPDQDRAPIRILGAVGEAPGGDFFGPGAASAKLAPIVAVLEKGAAMPEELNLGRAYAPDVLNVLKHLAVYWSDTPPTRAAERRATTARITVVPGYSRLLEEIEREKSDALNFIDRAAESWVVENVSDNGYGALVPAAATEWIRAGELVGVQLEGSAGWAISVVRRVVRDEKRQYHVGLQVISRNATLAPIVHGAGRENESAMLLDREPDTRGEVGVVLRTGRYDPANSLELDLDGQAHLLMPSSLVETGEDYDRAMYKVLRKNS